MLQWMNQYQNNLRKLILQRQNNGGQVAVILILVIAIGLVFFAASINLSLVAQNKTLTTKAANAASSTMSSLLASYGEQIFQVTLGGQAQKCSTSGSGFWQVLTLVVLVALAIFAPQLAPYIGQAMAAAVQAGAIIASTMEAASIVITMTIDPGFADMWNRMQMANLSMTGQFVERGVQAGLQGAVTDQVKLPDLYDLDQDGVFGYPGQDETKPPLDTVSRFSIYNTMRYMQLHPSNDVPIKNFLEALHDLVVKDTVWDTDNWALWDPVFYPDPILKTHGPSANAGNPCFNSLLGPGAGLIPAECDPCCNHFDLGAIPGYCDPTSGEPQAGIRATCSSRSPFRSINAQYPYVFDGSYEDSTNSFMSFREQLGRDDEHHLYHATATTPNWHLAEAEVINNGNPNDQGFFLKDVVGYYNMYSTNLSLINYDKWVYPSPPGNTVPVAPKLYSFLYKMKDWGPDLASLSYSNYECHWCDSSEPNDPGKTCPSDLSTEMGGTGRLSLGFDPSGYTYNQSWCVDRRNQRGDKNLGAQIGANDPPLIADKVGGLPDGIKPSGTPAPIYVDDGQCAIPSSTTVAELPNLDHYVNGWKRGADRYCTATDPYNINCPKSGGGPADQANPQCGQTINGVSAAPANQWPDDWLDDMTYGSMPGLFALEGGLWKQRLAAGDFKALAKTVRDWYVGPVENLGMADFIEPPCLNTADCPESYTKKARPGHMWKWRSELQFFNSSIQAWLKPPAGQEYSTVRGLGPDAVWCVPQKLINGNEWPGISAAEALTFDANNNGFRGDVYDVIQCLNWNATDTRTYVTPGVAPASGNAEKFERCANPLTCGTETCSNLPRSLNPEFYTLPTFSDPISGDRTKFLNCLATATIQQCGDAGAGPGNDLCDNSILPSASPYNLPAFNNPDMTRVSAIEAWCAGPNSTQPGLGMCNGFDLNCATNRDACRCSWANDCAAIAGECLALNTCDTAQPNLPCHNYAIAVNQAAQLSNGSCQDPHFRDVMQKSYEAARAQVEKFKHRAAFLQGRYEEAMSLAQDAASLSMPDAKFVGDGVLTTGIKKLTAFLDNGTPFSSAIDSPAERFIDAMNNLANDITGDLPAFGVYVWQDPDPERALNFAGNPRGGEGHGYWHAVKVDVRLPRRCAGNCEAWDWPKTEASESGGEGFLGMSKKLCYSLANTTGMTKARIIRYDQDKDLAGLIFPGGQQIWQSRLSHPGGSTAGNLNADTTGLRQTCAVAMDPDLARWLADPNDPRSKLGAAFMLNKVPDLSKIGDGSDDGQYADCWVRVHQALLTHGIQSESCAEYYFAGNGFRVRFKPCDNWQ